MEQELGSREKGVGSREQGLVGAGLAPAQDVKPKPALKEIDRLRLERLNLSIGNLNLQLALLNERARALQIETTGFRAEREGLVKGIMESSDCVAGKWRLNPDAMTFEEIKVGVENFQPLLEGRGKGEGEEGEGK